MADQRERKRKRAGSEKRDQNHRPGGDWTTLSVPVGMQIFKPSVGISKVDIVPYEAGEGNKNADSGEWYYERTYFRHVQIGANNSMYICSAATFNRPCPICDHLTKLSGDPHSDQDVLDGLKPKQRQLFLVLDLEAKDEGVQLWDVAPFNFGELLDEERRNAEEDEDFIRNFDDELAGASLKIRFSEANIGKTKFPKASKIDFKPRPDGLNEKWLEHGVCLDSLLKEMSYSELKAIFLQTGGSTDGKPQPDETKQPESRQSKTAEECGIRRMDEVVYNGEICTVSRVSSDGLTLIDPEDEVIKAVAPSEVTKAEDVKEPIPQEPVEQIVKEADPSTDDKEPDWDEDWDND